MRGIGEILVPPLDDFIVKVVVALIILAAHEAVLAIAYELLLCTLTGLRSQLTTIHICMLLGNYSCWRSRSTWCHVEFILLCEYSGWHAQLILIGVWTWGSWLSQTFSSYFPLSYRCDQFGMGTRKVGFVFLCCALLSHGCLLCAGQLIILVLH